MRMKPISQAALVAAPRSNLIAFVLLLGVTPAGFAADYSIGAAIETKVSQNDNLRMTEDDELSVTKYMVAPRLSLSAKTERSTASLNTLLFFNRYDEDEFNSDDQNVGLSLMHQFENSSISLNANLVRESTITSETLTSGIIGDQADRTERYVASPSWLYYLNDTNMIQLQGSYQEQDYDASNYTGYKNTSATFDWIHVWSERLKLILSANYSDYESDDRTFEIPVAFPIGSTLGTTGYSTRTKDKGGQVGMDYQWSSQTLLQARIGSSQSTTNYPLANEGFTCPNQIAQLFGALCEEFDEDKSRASTAQLNWSWNNEKNTVNVGAVKQTQPTANGYTVDALRITSDWTYKLTERDQVSTYLSVVRNRSKGDTELPNSAAADRDYESATLAYQRQLSEEWFVNASYQYNNQEYSEADVQASSNIVTVGVRYKPQEWHWAR